MNEQSIKLCDECKTGFPAKCFVQEVDTWRLVCTDCSKKLNDSPVVQHTARDIDRAGIYGAEVPQE